MSGSAVRVLSGLLVVLIFAACGESKPTAEPAFEATSDGASDAASAATAATVGADARAESATRATDAAPASRGIGTGIGNRTGEVLNPDDNTVVFLYHELAGIEPPMDQWVEADSRVNFVMGPNKAARRSEVRAELEAAAAAVRNVGFIRLSMNADLSEYDPTYGEFTVRALAPSSTVTFKSFNQKVSLRFGNGRDAQVWAVPQERAGAIRDELGYGRNVSLDALLRISGVQPAPGGGTIVTEVVEYEMRVANNGKLLGRVKPVSK